RFFAGLASEGWRVAGTMAFRDHHTYTDRDIARVLAAARSAGATIVMTTEKDAERLRGRPFSGLPFAAVPLAARIVPADAFAEWLCNRVTAARRSRSDR